MKIIILEGIATSGKTSVRNELENILTARNADYLFVEEEETLLPLLHNKSVDESADYLRVLLQKYTASRKEVLIFDRLFLTHVWRVQADIERFRDSLTMLMDVHTTICFLQIPEQLIPARVGNAMAHRDEQWVKYVKSKASTDAEIFEYYIGQQKKLLTLLDEIPLPHKVFDTGDTDFRKIASEIAGMI